jgi:hypothetical protein
MFKLYATILLRVGIEDSELNRPEASDWLFATLKTTLPTALAGEQERKKRI